MYAISKEVSSPTIPIHTLVDEILIRATTSTIGRCRCVCKVLQKLLSTPVFVARHFTRPLHPANQKTLLITGDTCSIFDIDGDTGSYGTSKPIATPFATKAEDIMILSHVKGLLCVALQHSGEMYLWNPTTTEYVLLPATNSYGRYTNIDDAVALFMTKSNDIKLFHLTRRSEVLQAHIYSCDTRTWRPVPFDTQGKYLTRSFTWSSGTFSNNSLYFTVTECWLQGHNTIIKFHTETETFIELPFPPIPYTGLFQSVLLDVEDNLHMVLTAGMQKLSHSFWIYVNDAWQNIFTETPIPDIPLSLWVTITHYLTDGRWFILTNSTVLHTITRNIPARQPFYAPSWFRGYVGALLQETITSPHVCL